VYIVRKEASMHLGHLEVNFLHRVSINMRDSRNAIALIGAVARVGIRYMAQENARIRPWPAVS
jgi:hypothetical protein